MNSPTSQPRRANRLASATSPYLLQHAHNPVDWYPWGESALSRAKRENKPIFLSIGYSACHWCHVMERESFENEAIAKLLNQDFVSIKVDREERPDLDDLYMKATVLYNRGQGGWPMSVFLTPDLKPFFAGTYFPPEGRWGRPGFGDLLREIARLWRDEPQKIGAGAEALTAAVREHATFQPGTEEIAHAEVARYVALVARAFDAEKGGISGGGTNKFPPSMAMDLMLRAHRHSLGAEADVAPQQTLLKLVETTLDHMANGGIYDQLGGGIARYSTDVDWLVPHFEKMLYDQALVCGIYLDGFQATDRPLYARVAGEICDYVIGDLQSPEGGYYSTRDADSEGVEGRYYVWSHAEVVAALGAADAKLFCAYFDITEAGNWEGHNILHVPRSAEVVARSLGVSEAELSAALERGRRKLLEIRARRVPPHRDDKILSGWNGLMIASMARAGCVLEQPRYVESARRAADFVLTRMRTAGRLQHTTRDGVTHTPAFLDDHAFLIEGLINLYEATFEPRWLDEAERLTDDVMKHFRDPQAGGFFYTADDAEQVLTRIKDADDGAIPTGNSVMLMNLLRLGRMVGREELTAEGERLMRGFSRRVVEQAGRNDRLLAAVDFHHGKSLEVVLIAPREGAELAALRRAIWRTYAPNKVVIGVIGDPATAAKRTPLLEGRSAKDGKATAYVCENFACKAPTTDPAELKRQLSP